MLYDRLYADRAAANRTVRLSDCRDHDSAGAIRWSVIVSMRWSAGQSTASKSITSRDGRRGDVIDLIPMPFCGCHSVEGVEVASAQ